MSKFDIVRAWKDEAYRHSLSTEEQAQLPPHPSGEIELSDEVLQVVAGAQGTAIAFTAGCCPYTSGENWSCTMCVVDGYPITWFAC